jgi:predicted phosphohydrolase
MGPNMGTIFGQNGTKYAENIWSKWGQYLVKMGPNMGTIFGQNGTKYADNIWSKWGQYLVKMVIVFGQKARRS